jgi:hypothetical protein
MNYATNGYKGGIMNKKEKFAHVSLLMSVDQKKDLDAYCKKLDLNTSQLARRLILMELKNKTWAKIEKATINGTNI